MKKSGFIFLWLLLFALSSNAGPSVFHQDGIRSALLSPDGQHIALLNRVGDIDQLLILSVEKKNTAYSRKLMTPHRIRSVAWVDDKTLALQLGKDVKYHLEPQHTGEIEILGIDGNSMLIGGASKAKTTVQQALSGAELIIRDGLPSISDVFLVTDQVDRNLWRINLHSDSIEPLDYPPIHVTRLSVSPTAKYMAVEGINDSGQQRAMVWSNMDDGSWKELDGNPEIVAVSDSGIVFAIMEVETGVASLVSVAIATGAKTVLFQHESFAVDQVMVDGFNQPFAARYVPGLPSWFYLDESQRLARLHKSFRAAVPNADVSFANSSIDGGLVIARQSSDNYPDSFFLVDTKSGHTERLLDSTSGLSIVGGEEEDDNYKLQPIQFTSETGSEVSGYISVPQDDSARERPAIVMFQDESDESRWQWGFNEEPWFFHRQGFNALMVNRNPVTTPAARISDVEDAIRWSIQEGLVKKRRLCLFGRGTGAQIALLIALRNDEIDCLISFGGTFGNLDLVVETGQASKPKSRRLNALLIYGTDDSSEQLASQHKVQEVLTSFGGEVDTMAVAGEQRVFSSRQNAVRALARISSFLRDEIAPKNTWPTLPLIHGQAIEMNSLHEAIAARSEQGVFDTKDWRQWFEANNQEARKSLFAEQLPLYDSYQKEIVEMAEGRVSENYVRFVPIRKNSITH